jgi:hypothetical protein
VDEVDRDGGVGLADAGADDAFGAQGVTLKREDVFI